MDETAVANAQVSDSNAADGAVNGHTTAAEAAQEDNKFQRAISAWRTIDLTHLVPKLDTTAAEIVTQQKESLVERKDLAQKTKDFRKLDDEAKVVEIKALLKGVLIHVVLVWLKLTCVSSIPNIYRSRVQSVQVRTVRLPSNLFTTFGSTRSISTPGSICRVVDRGRRDSA